jgi:glutamate decarboxylase
MPLHEKDSIRENLLDDVYASAYLSHSLPKCRIPDSKQDPRHAYSVVHDELMLDGSEMPHTVSRVRIPLTLF